MGAYATLAAVVLMSAILQGVVGFGFSFIVVPALVLIEPTVVPAAVLIMALPMTLMVVSLDRQGVQLRGLADLTLARLAGTVVGVALLKMIPDRQLSVAMGGFVLLGVGLYQIRGNVDPGRGARIAVGVVSGTMGTAAAIGGPPLALLYAGRDGRELRGTLSALFFVGVLISLGGLSLANLVSSKSVLLAVSLMPLVVLGVFISRILVKRVDRESVSRAVLLLSVISGLSVLLKGLLGF